ncbi:Mmp37-domain-containing protein [Auriculariales sp. MPI-PUGE-AT-0066]|nr:Mmp37-domain-containing protein [Auriculariales sp. MPI-PUGE-AT-0066]
MLARPAHHFRAPAASARRAVRALHVSSSALLQTVTSTSSASAPPLPPPSVTGTGPSTKSTITRPRPLRAFNPRPLPPGYPTLPTTFGRNQMLSVPDATRALLEEIVSSFNAPIRYAFAYGSGVFDQAGYTQGGKENGKRPMIDFVFAVTHSAHWHSINMAQNPSHYPLYAQWIGADFVTGVQAIAPGMWFNTLVPWTSKDGNQVTIKYGVTTVDNLCADLLYWRSLYLAGRMHKPIRIIADDARVRLTQQVNLTSAVRTSLATLPEKFDERLLFERIAGLSYAGDLRMSLPAESRGKVSSIVSAQAPQFRELYHRLAVGLPGVHWSGSTISQDVSPAARSALVRKLPGTLRARVESHYTRKITREGDEGAFYTRIGSDSTLGDVVQREIANIVRAASTMQSFKGLVSAGPVKSTQYVAAKVGKWWRGSAKPNSS